MGAGKISAGTNTEYIKVKFTEQRKRWSSLLFESLTLANKTTWDFQLRLQSKALTAKEIKLVFAETSKKKLSKMQDKN